MKLSKIRILNYKSVDDATIEVRKLADSYTTIFVGKNESGKSNLLEAISFLAEPEGDFDFEALKNAQNDSINSINFVYSFEFESNSEWRDILTKKVIMPDEVLLNINVHHIEKNIYITPESRKINSKSYVVTNNLDSNLLSRYCYVKLDPSSKYTYEIKSKSNIEENSNIEYKDLSKEGVSEILNDIFRETIEKNKLNVIKWQYSDRYLITRTIDLNEFKDDTTISYPLKNIFKVANLKTDKEIKSKIEALPVSPKNINKLEKILENATSDYIAKIWPESKVQFKFKIQNDLKLSVYIVDLVDEENSFYMSDRSEGFKKFMSLILSISAENNADFLKNNVILIDEPEIHMHPSGIKYMRDELMRIGERNYVFVATHSEFMIDTDTKERQYIVVKKDNRTYVSNWEANNDLPGDEILRQAFGISILKEFITKYNISGDKQLENGINANKALKALYPELFGAADILDTIPLMPKTDEELEIDKQKKFKEKIKVLGKKIITKSKKYVGGLKEKYVGHKKAEYTPQKDEDYQF